MDIDTRPDWLPHLDALQQEIVKATKVLAVRDDLFVDVCTRCPGRSPLHICLGELECRAMLGMKQALETVGARPIALVHDGIYFLPMGVDIHSQEFKETVAVVEAVHGITIKLKTLAGERLNWKSSVEQVDALSQDVIIEDADNGVVGDYTNPFAGCCEITTELLTTVLGNNMCAPTALLNMNLVDGEPTHIDMANGPYTYRQLENYYHITFNQVALEELLCPAPNDKFILHIGAQNSCGHSIGLLPEPFVDTCYAVLGSHNDYLLQSNDEVAYECLARFSSVPGSTRCFLLRVQEGDPPERIFDNVACLDTSSGAANKRRREREGEQTSPSQLEQAKNLACLPTGQLCARS